MKRVKAYFEKIKEVENPATRELRHRVLYAIIHSKRLYTGTLVVDRAAANRFIRAAISDAKAASLEARDDFPPLPSVGKHTRFTHMAASTSTVAATGTTSIESTSEGPTDDTSSSDSDLEVIDNVRLSEDKGKGKETPREPASAPVQGLASTKRRRMVDPFQGTNTEPRHDIYSISY